MKTRIYATPAVKGLNLTPLRDVLITVYKSHTELPGLNTFLQYFSEYSVARNKYNQRPSKKIQWICSSWRWGLGVKGVDAWDRILVYATIYRRLLIGWDGISTNQ